MAVMHCYSQEMTTVKHDSPHSELKANIVYLGKISQA